MESLEMEVDPATSLAFPKSVRFQSPTTAPLTLVGLGVHTVGWSAVQIQAYTVGFYADITGVDLSAIPVEERVDWLIRNRSSAIRLAPTRYASFQRIRDGFVQALKALQQETVQTDGMQDTIHRLKGLPPSPELQSKTPFYLVSSPDVEPTKTEMPAVDGDIRRAWVEVNFLRSYLQSDAPSPAMRESIQHGVERL